MTNGEANKSPTSEGAAMNEFTRKAMELADTMASLVDWGSPEAAELARADLLAHLEGHQVISDGHWQHFNDMNATIMRQRRQLKDMQRRLDIAEGRLPATPTEESP